MTTLMQCNKANEKVKLSATAYEELWAARKAWAQAHVYPVFRSVFNEDFLKSRFADLCVGLRTSGAPDGNNVRKILWGHGPVNGMSYMGNTLVNCIVLINSGPLQNYQFFVGITGDMKKDQYVKKSQPNSKSFSLAFAATYYHITGSRTGHTPHNYKTVGLPGPDQPVHGWVKSQILKHWEYWLEHSMKHSRNCGSVEKYEEPNEWYPDFGNFRFPDEL